MNAQDLIDIEEIKQLKAKYFRLMDTKQWDDWVALFSETCEAIYEGYEPKRGGAEIVDFVRGMLDTGVTVHFGHMAEVVVTDSRSATGVWSMSDYLDCPGTLQLRGYGHYHDEFVKDDSGTWRIDRLQLVRLRIDQT